MIKVESLNKTFNNIKALDNVNMHVKKGSIYGLVGENGAGKTTLIKHIMGVYKQDSGEIKIDNEDIYENNNSKQKIAYISDELYYFPQYTVQKMAGFYKRIYPNWDDKRYMDIKGIFKIDETRKIGRLSKGMQKQVAFCLALASMPKTIVLDEPIDGIDPYMRKKVWNLIIEDVAERKATVLISSHNLKELENVCDHVGILHRGKMIIEKDLDHLKSDVNKIQIAFKDSFPDEIKSKINILYEEKTGSVYNLIVRGDKNSVVNTFYKHNPKPILLDVLPLTLEEIFIYELGGAGYEIKTVL
ncbi:ABC transporter ATP-binding protein [Wukongibacter sp. M2B1]|uniref:ABC transporter ATP-binding protein n=1 Tax=Wukongibacter sp. M2B1 TaxID=3088895 RepID=UPI003D790179